MYVEDYRENSETVISNTENHLGKVPKEQTWEWKKGFWDCFYIIIGCMLSAFAITSILKSNGLITGGITGISLIIGKVAGINFTYIYYILSILVLITAWVTMGRAEGLKIIALSILFPIFLIVFEKIGFCLVKGDMILAGGDRHNR